MGEVDYEGSYYLPMDVDSVYKLERSLHFLLSSRAVEFDDGDGKTELFSIGVLEQALKHIELYLSLNPNTPPLRKGIPKIIKKEQPRKVIGKYKRLKNKSKNFFNNLSSCNEKLEKIQKRRAT